MSAEKIRVLISKCGLDGHDRGARVVARGLRDLGFEVIYLGLFQTPEAIVTAAIQEDADVIGISTHNAAHMTIFAKITDLLRKNAAEGILVIGGGIVPKEDLAPLREMGVAAVFGPGTPMQEFAEFIRAEVAKRRAASGG